jgi:3-hydroxyisobutyrate dehydrogenase-like beta-hydroxyacid dehydrogenase
VARILIVGCGCRGRGLAASLREGGHLVRGTTRDPDMLEAIRAAAGEAALADPDRLGTLLPQLAGVSVVCWLMGSSAGAPESVAALHGPRLQSLLSKLVDTPVRGIVYEAAGSVSSALLAEGGVAARAASATYRMPVRVVEVPPGNRSGWRAAMLSAVEEILSA